VSDAHLGQPAARRKRALIAVLLIGVGLIAAPAVFQMFHRAPQGATMLKQFKPYMSNARLGGYQRDIRQIDAGVREAAATAGVVRLPAGVTAFRSAWRPIDADMTDLLGKIRANVGNYGAVAALPSFTLFPWFFVVPGVLLVALAVLALWRPRWRPLPWLLVALGAGLIAAPFVFQMFDRAPKGQRMIAAFKTIETRDKVQQIQGYFSTIAVGQGALRLQLVPALEKSGLSDAQIAARYPAVTTLDRRWIAILGDLTPMIGVMSDNVTRYEAVADLPPFSLFPWFFVIPGVLTIALALVARAGGAGASTSSSSVSDLSLPQPTGAT
jgi:hypothetical protein